MSTSGDAFGVACPSSIRARVGFAGPAAVGHREKLGIVGRRRHINIKRAGGGDGIIAVQEVPPLQNRAGQVNLLLRPKLDLHEHAGDVFIDGRDDLKFVAANQGCQFQPPSAVRDRRSHWLRIAWIR